MKITCIIPSYNEAPRIDKVLDAVCKSGLVSEILVMDDCSTDNTVDIVFKYPNVKYIKQEKNQGKSKTVCNGIKLASGEIIFLLDADLMNLTVWNIDELLKPVLNGVCVFSISLRNTYPAKDPVSEKLGIDHLSGERVFKKELILPYLGEIENLKGFGLETFINKIIVKNKYSIKIVKWPNVFSPLKSYKYNLTGKFVDVKDYFKMWGSVFSVCSPAEIFNNIRIMRHLIVKDKLNFSVIVPAYNEEKYIGKCLESLIKVSNNNFHEIIVIDNASTDETSDVAKKFANVKVIKVETKGVTHARQRGFKEASGDVIVFVDADSYVSPNWYTILTSEFENNEKTVALSGICKYYDFNFFQNFWVWVYWHFLAMPIYFILGYMMISGNFALRRTVLEKMRGLDTSIKFYGDDTNTARRAHKFGKVKFKTDFFIYTSGRRLLQAGIIKIFFIYALNFVSEVVRKKQFTVEVKDYR